MLHNNSLIALAFILMLLCLLSCTKDSPVESNNNNIDKKLFKIITDSANYSTLYYANGKVQKYETIRNADSFLSILLNYDENGKIKTEELIQNDINYHMLNKYLYDVNGRIEKIELNLLEQNQQNFFGYLEYQYDQDVNPTKINQIDASGKLTMRLEDIYDSRGNVIERKRFSNNTLIDKTLYEYDNNINPLKILYSSFFIAKPVTPNNIIKSTLEDFQLNRSFETKNNYLYDNDGYPIKCISKFSDGINPDTEIIQEFQYN